MSERELTGDVAGGGLSGSYAGGGRHFFYTDSNGSRVENYQADLDSIVGNLGGEFRFGVSPQGHVATLLSDASCHDVTYGGRQVNNLVAGVLELKPTKGGRELDAEGLEYERVGEAYVPVVQASYGDGVTGEFFATRDGVGVVRYRGEGVSTVEDPRLFIRNESSPNVYLKQMDTDRRTGTKDVNGESLSYEVDVFRMRGDSWGENRAIVMLKYATKEGQDVLFSFTALKDADREAARLVEKAGDLDGELGRAKDEYARIMRDKDIDVFGTFTRHLEQVLDTYGRIPQRIRIDGKPASTWGEQVDQFAIPISTIREVGERAGRPVPERSSEERDRLYRVGELVEVMHFFPRYGSFSASLPFDATVVPLRSTDPAIRYTASGGYGGMEWPGRDGAHIAGDLARDGWLASRSKDDVYRASWPLVQKLVAKLEEKVGPNLEVPTSFCPWEHFAGRLAYVGIEVAQGFRDASRIAADLGYHDKARDWASKADALKQKVVARFWDDKQGYFIREEHDAHLDSSPNMAAILTGFLDLGNSRERSMAERILDSTEARSSNFGGILRMEDEYYIGRNPWFVCTGQYVQALEKVADAAEAAGEADKAKGFRAKADSYLEWLAEHQNASGTYAEQKMFHQPPRTDAGSPIKPLTGWTLLPWSEVEVRKAVIARDEG